MSAPVCDGCGREASAEHIAGRIERLQWATRFRPIHIQALFVGEAPSARREEDYAALLDALRIPAAADGADGEGLTARVAEFQKRGCCLAFLVECPLEGAGVAALRPGSPEVAERLAATLVKRILYSYRPKQIVLLGAATRPLVAALQKAGLGASLVLEQGAPLELPQGGAGKPRDLTSVWERLQSAGAAAS